MIAALLLPMLWIMAATVPLAAESVPRLSPGVQAVLAGGIDSLGRATGAGHGTGAPTPVLLSRVPVDVPQAALDAGLKGTVRLQARVSTAGLVDSVRVLSGDSRLRACAVASARWWLYAAPAQPTWTTLEIEIDGSEPADPIVPDVIGLASDSERRGAWLEAAMAWIGALNRIGRHPTLRNEWALREHIIQVAKRATTTPGVTSVLLERCQYARGSQFRTLARSDHESFVRMFDDALLMVPWWPDGYQWRAASLLTCSRGEEAMRTLMLFRAAAADSAARSLAQRAITGLAAGDTLGTAQLLKREGQQFNLDEAATGRH